MNFLQYCLATKNYSAIDAVRCYAKNKSNVGKYVATGLGAAALTGAPLGYMLHESNKDRDTAKSERDTAVKDKETAVAAQKAAEQEAQENERAIHEVADERDRQIAVNEDLMKKLNETQEHPLFRRFATKKAATDWMFDHRNDGSYRLAYDHKNADGDYYNDYVVYDINDLH